MKRIAPVFLLLLTLLAGCAKEEPYQIIKSESLPAKGSINGKTVTVTDLGFYEHDGVVYAIAFLDTSDLKKPFSGDFVDDHFFNTSHLTGLDGIEGYPALDIRPGWYTGKLSFATDQGNTVCLCAGYQKSTVDSADGYTISISLYSDEYVDTINDAGQAEKVQKRDTILVQDLPIEMRDYDSLSAAIRQKIEE